jgi:hypothetical protein
MKHVVVSAVLVEMHRERLMPSAMYVQTCRGRVLSNGIHPARPLPDYALFNPQLDSLDLKTRSR